MKKIFSLFAAVLMAGSLCANTSTWTMNTTAGLAEITATQQGSNAAATAETPQGGDVELSKDDVTVTATLGYFKGSGSDGIQVYKNGTMTVNAPTGYVVTEIVMTLASSCYPFAEAPDAAWTLNKGKTSSQQDGTYTISPAATSVTFTNNSAGQTKVKKLVITLVPTTVNLGAAGLATFSADFIFTVTGATAYKAAVSGTDINLTALEGAIPANTAVILKGEADATATIGTAATAAADVTGNELVGTASATHTVLGSEYIYCLTKGTNEFNQVAEGVKIPWNKAYFSLLGVPAAPLRIAMPEEVATGVENVATVKATKALVNGQLVIVKNGQKFNLNGMLVK